MPLFRSRTPEPVVAPTRSRSLFARRSVPPTTTTAATTAAATDPIDPAAPVTTTRSGFWGRRRRSSLDGRPLARDGTALTTTRRRGGLFRRTSSSSLSDTSSRRRARNGTALGTGVGTGVAGAGVGTGLFGRRNGDMSLDAARGKVHAAELAERGADRALIAARNAVVEAKRHVEALEAEANEQARLAQEKVLATRSIKRDARGLGRHG